VSSGVVEPASKGPLVRELVLALGFLALLIVGALTVARPELSDAPEEAGAAGASAHRGMDGHTAGATPPLATP
jgi:hypothetical protein